MTSSGADSSLRTKGKTSLKPLLISRLRDAFIAVSASVLGGSATLAQEPFPRVYAWDTSNAWLSYLSQTGIADDNMTLMVAVNLNSDIFSPEEAADRVCQQIWDRLYPVDAPTTLRDDNICILLGNFGTTTISSERTPCNFFVAADHLDQNPSPWPTPIPPFPAKDPDPDSRERHRNPWMSIGITQCASWMEAFLDRYDVWWGLYADTEHPKPIPARFHFDTEFTITNLGTNNWTHHLWYVAQDARYSDSGSDLPGFPAGTTLEYLWDQSKSNLYTGTPPATLEDAVNELRSGNSSTPLLVPHHATCQPVFLWWLQVCARIKEGAMQAAAYDVIHAHGVGGPEAAAWAACKVSNYEASQSDGKPVTYVAEGAWHFQRTDSNPSPFEPASVGPVSSALRAVPETGFNHGAYSQHVYDEYSVILPDSSYHDFSGRWLEMAYTRLGDMDAPVFYAVRRALVDELPQYLQEPLYYKLLAYDNDNRSSTSATTNESRWRSSLRNHEYVYQSLHATAGHTNFDEVAAWMSTPNVLWDKPEDTFPDAPDYFTEEDCRNQLALHRAEQGGEILLWNTSDCYQTESGWDCDPDATGYYSRTWPVFATCFHDVYDPYVYSFTPTIGTLTSPDGLDDDDPERLNYITLRTDLGSPSPTSTGEYRASLNSPSVCSTLPGVGEVCMYPVVSEMQVEFRNVIGMQYQDGLQLNVRTEVTGNHVTLDQAQIRGRIYAWDWAHTAWVQVTRTSLESEIHPEMKYETWQPPFFEEEPAPPVEYEYGFYTPSGPSQARRSFFFHANEPLGGGQTARFVSNSGDGVPSGSVRVKLVHIVRSVPSSLLLSTNRFLSFFNSSYDLVQLVKYRIPIELSSSLMSGEPESSAARQGADIDYTGILDDGDFDSFVRAWMSDAPLADFNGDGLINSTDVSDFLDDWVEDR
jgi:hypothetical protein